MAEVALNGKKMFGVLKYIDQNHYISILNSKKLHGIYLKPYFLISLMCDKGFLFVPMAF